MQGKSRITSLLHHIATSDIASTDVGPGLPSLGQEDKTKVFVILIKKEEWNIHSPSLSPNPNPNCNTKP